MRLEQDPAHPAADLPQAHLLLRAVLVVVRAQVKAALVVPVELLEQDRAEHPVVDVPTRSSILRMARFHIKWLLARNRTT